MAQTPQRQTYSLPPAAPFGNHGRTTAAWVLLWTVVAAFLLGGLGLMLEATWLVIVGVAALVVGVVASVVLRGMGLGQPTGSEGDERARDWYDS